MSTLYQQALARSTVYRFLSTCFLYPDETVFAMLHSEVKRREVREALRSLASVDSQQHSLLFAAYGSLLTAGCLPDALRAEHGRLFGHLISQECSPYETQYGKPHIFQQAQEMGDIAGFYRAFGVEVSQTAKERLDHIAVELEFMHFLAFKEAYALERHGAEPAEICREAQKKFLRDHLGRWAPSFCRRLQQKTSGGYYQELAQLAAEFLAIDMKILDVELANSWELDSSEPEGDCFSCETKDFCFAHPVGED